MAQIKNHDLYQLLVTECRYGYTRNNHLMPRCAYDHIKAYLPLICKEDNELGISTATQLMEECISNQLCRNYDSGLDDEFGNRKEALDFIQYLKDWLAERGVTNMPYNYTRCLDNIKRADSLKYDIVSLKPGTFEAPNANPDEVLASGLTRDAAGTKLMTEILGTDNAIWNCVKIMTEDGFVLGQKFRIIQPAEHQGELYAIILKERN